MLGRLAVSRKFGHGRSVAVGGFGRFETDLIDQDTKIDGGFLTGCGCPSNKIAVRTDGTIIPCCMLAHIELGRINLDSFLEVWQQSPALNRLRQRHTIPLTEFRFCSECDYVSYCTGNCPGLAFTLSGQLNYPSPDACLRRYFEDGGKLPEITKERLCASS